MVDLSVKIGDMVLANPIQPASGAFSWEYADVIDLNRLGALVAKTICREPRVGNPTPRMAETEAGIIQSIGLPGKGIDYFLDHIVPEYAKFEPPLVIANTFLSLKIRTDNFRPALGNKFGGLVSPALKPIVLRMVYQVAKEVSVPIIGIGGVTKAEDVVEYMLAGASAVGIGYAGFRNPTALTTIIDDLEAWCEDREIERVSELIGAVRDDDMETDTLAAASAGV